MTSPISTTQTRRSLRRCIGLAVAAGALLVPAASQAADFAVVSADGDLARGKNVLSARQFADGQYQVNFTRPVNQCILTAAAGDPGTIIQGTPVTITVGPISGNPNAAFVVIRNAVDGVGRDQGFHLNATCDGRGIKGAVVNPTGTLARGFGATTATRISTGQYQVTFDRNVTDCAYNASIGGAVNTNVQRGMAAVAQRFGTPNAVQVTTFDAATGAVADRGFHLNVTCGAKKRFVVTTNDGNLVRDGRPSFPTGIADGNYQVKLFEDVQQCAYIATAGAPFDDPVDVPRHVGVSLRSNDPTSLFVTTRDRLGFRVPQGIHLTVVC
jgi:hypothetical protein